VRFELAGKSQFVLKTPTLSGESIQNMLEIAGKLMGLANWKHDKFFIVEELYSAVDWSFIGTKEKASTVEFSGQGGAVLSFLRRDIGRVENGGHDRREDPRQGRRDRHERRAREEGRFADLRSVILRGSGPEG
jgi:hypothetical protein